ncbi:MAG: hypothetical protein M1480_03400 [Bacteroidetes bacterium]|nr:hypothetical protein [Bacteroidota bacterium]
MKSKIFLALCIILTLPYAGAAQTKPFNVALFNPIQIFPENNSIEGIRINFIYGKNASVTGFDWGLVNQVGSGGMKGIQWGFINLNDGNVVGWQSGAINLNERDVKGFQVGWYNKGAYVSGLQLGLVNSAESLYGIQIGLINFIKTGGQFPVFPIVNWSF